MNNEVEYILNNFCVYIDFEVMWVKMFKSVEVIGEVNVLKVDENC